MKKVKRIAKLVALNIMILHDQARYKELEKNSAKIVELIGYTKHNAKKVGHDVKNIYIHYDRADRFYKEKKFGKEKIEYERARNIARKINKQLKTKYDCSAMVDWVVYWRHKKFKSAISVFIRDWYKKTGSIISAIKCAHYIYRAGKAHDLRNYKVFEKQFEQVYLEASKNRKEKLPIFF